MREGDVRRSTKETEIRVELCLDGEGKSEIDCEDRFLRHMIESLAKYASFDIEMEADGDNAHHLVEDVALTLGMAMREAIGEQPVQRIGWAVVPMDDALVTVSVDLIDRPYADIDCPDGLYHHFFRSFAMSSDITLHTVVNRGFDEHHIIEACFKALGLSLKQAVAPREELLSTKDEPSIEKG